MAIERSTSLVEHGDLGPSYRRRFRSRLPVVTAVWIGLGLLGISPRLSVGMAGLLDLAATGVGAFLVSLPTTLLVALVPGRERTREATPRTEPPSAAAELLTGLPVRKLLRLHRRRRWLVIVTAALALALAAGVADRALARYEMGQLLTSVQASESGLQSYTSWDTTLVKSIDAGTFDKSTLLEQITTNCEKSAVDVQVARTGVTATRVSFWHPSIAAAQTDYLAHNQAWVDYLRACASEATAFTDKAYTANISATRKVAMPALEAALPWPADPDQVALVERINAG